LIINGTIFFDRTNNVLKAIEADGITDLVQKSTNATIDLGDGTGDHSGATVVGSTYYLNQVTAGTGMEVTKDSSNVLTYSVDSAHVKNTALSNISVTSGALAYNSTTGVITVPTSTTDIAEGTELYYTDSRARNAISVTGDLTYDSSTGVISYNRGPGDITDVVAGAGLTGGGTGGSVTLGVNTGTGLEVVSDQVRIALTGVTSASYGTNAATIPRFTVNGQGQLTSANTQPIAITASQVTDMSEAVDDRVSSLLVGGDNVSITYDDGANLLTIDADLSGDITGVSAGAGLTGGGSTGDVTLNIGAGTGINVNTDDIEVNMSAFDTDDLSEGLTNLYFTNARADARVTATLPDTDSLSEGSNNFYFTNARADARIAAANTDDLSEGSNNRYFTNERVDDRVSSLLQTSGNLSFTYNDGSNTLVLSQSLTTTDVMEGDNQYFTTARARSAISASGDISYNSSTGVISFSQAAQLVTSVNLQTGAVVLDTGDVAEGSNQYFTTARARSAVGAGGDISYNSGTGVFSFTERTDAEVRGLLSGGAGITYNSSTGEIALTDTGYLTGVTAGNGLTGGGSSGTPTINVAGGYGITVNANNIETSNADIRGLFSASGDLTYNSSTGAISFTERTEAQVRSLFSASGDLSYNSSTGAFSVTTFKTSGARAAISVSDGGGFGALSYNSTSGVISYTGPSTADIRGTISGGDGITFSGGSISVDKTDADIFDSSNTGNRVVIRNASGNFSANVITANTFDGVASSARYADLAEKYEADADYEPGTVVIFGGEKEITITDHENSARVAGVISTDPAYMMNAEADGLYVALRGRVPCKVMGKVKKGDVLVTSSTPGYAEVSGEPHFVGAACIVGKSLQSKDTDGPGVVEIVV
jgi:hypothetical protein